MSTWQDGRYPIAFSLFLFSLEKKFKHFYLFRRYCPLSKYSMFLFGKGLSIGCAYSHNGEEYPSGYQYYFFHRELSGYAYSCIR